MATNFPGPYELRIYYTVTINTVPLIHVQRLNLSIAEPADPGDIFDNYTVNLRGGTTDTLNDVTDAWVTIIRGFWSSAATIDYAELWRYTPGTFISEYVASYPIALAGNGAAAPVNSGQVLMTFRTLEGGVMKLSFGETGIAQAIPRAYAGMTTVEKAVVDHLIAPNAPFLARDTSYPIASIKSFPGQNEKTFKQRYRY